MHVYPVNIESMPVFIPELCLCVWLLVECVSHVTGTMKKSRRMRVQTRVCPGEPCTRGGTRSWWGRCSWPRSGRRRSRRSLYWSCCPTPTPPSSRPKTTSWSSPSRTENCKLGPYLLGFFRRLKFLATCNKHRQSCWNLDCLHPMDVNILSCTYRYIVNNVCFENLLLVKEKKSIKR